MPVDPLGLLMLARDNKHEEIKRAVELGIPPDICNQVNYVLS